MTTHHLPAIRVRNFQFLLLTRVFVMMALQAQAVIVGWQIYSLTKDPFMLGLTGLTEAVPAIIAALFAGHIVDISRPQRVYQLAVAVLTLNTGVLMLLAGGYVDVSVSYLLPIMFAGVFFSGLARSFIGPSSFSLLPQIVSRSHIPSATAWLSSGAQIATIGGPAVVGILYGFYGASYAWLMPFILMSCALLAISLVKVSNTALARDKREPAWQSIKAGWAYIFKHPVILSVMTLDMFAVLFGGAVAMLPAYADQILHVGAEGLGALRAAPAMGAVLTGLYFAIKPMKRVAGMWLVVVVAGFGCCMIGFGLSTVFWLSMLCLAVSGGFDCISMIIRGTLLQMLTPDTMRGRISSVNSMFIISSNEIGAFESGVAARYLGLVPSVVFGGMATLVVVAVTAVLSPQLLKIEIQTQDKKDDAPKK